jgi:serine/threonine protein kinase
MLDNLIQQMAFRRGSKTSTFQLPCRYLGCDLILLAVLEKLRFSSPTLARFRKPVEKVWEQQLFAVLNEQFAELSCNCQAFQSGFVCRHMLPELRKHADISVLSGSRFRLIYDPEIARVLLQNYPASSHFLSWDFNAQDTNTVSLLYQGLLRSKQRLRAGGSSTVYRVVIPEAHRAMWSLNGEEHVALKMIENRARNFSLWLNEKEVLQQLERFNHPNIVRLLDAYCIDNNFLLLFPLAQGDLEDFMSEEPGASQSRHSIFTWMLQQSKGLVKALEYLHVGNEHFEASGRHGDIKPENILLFRDVGAEKSTLGRFVISDLGLSQFQRKIPGNRDRYSSCRCDAVTANRNLADRKYAAPEIEVPSRISSAYDMWSLGCVLLEMILWLVEGATSRKHFLEHDLRSGVPGRPASYWYIEDKPPRRFLLKPQVSARLKQLNERTKEYTPLRALISHLTYGGLLDPNPLYRPTARDLGDILRLVENGTNSKHTTPVWNRSWETTIDDLDECSPLGHRDNNAVKPCFQSLGGEAPFQKGARSSVPAYTDNPFCHKFQTNTVVRISDSPATIGTNTEISDPFWQCDDPTECSWEDGLPFKQKCPFCDEIARPAALKPHIKSKHRYQHFYNCADCGGIFPDRKRLSSHREGVDVLIRGVIPLRITCTFQKDDLTTSVRELVHGAVSHHKPSRKARSFHLWKEQRMSLSSPEPQQLSTSTSLHRRVFRVSGAPR